LLLSTSNPRRLAVPRAAVRKLHRGRFVRGIWQQEARTRTCALALAIVAGGCGPLPRHGEEGVAGEGTFYYCERSSSCNSGEFPDAVAVSGTFFVGFDGDGTSTVESPQTDRLKALGAADDMTQFRALRAGPALLEARTPTSHRLVDAAHIQLEDIVSVDISAPGLLDHTDSGPPTLAIQLGRTPQLLVCAVPRGASRSALDGLLEWRWSSTDNGVVALETSTNDECRMLLPKAIGMASIVAASGDVSGSMTVTVGP
jgi:hypothetical protein